MESNSQLLRYIQSLENPTRERVKNIIHRSVAACFVLFQAFGLAGYFYAYDACNGNIFLNFGTFKTVHFQF
jgi:hypothetical protein